MTATTFGNKITVGLDFADCVKCTPRMSHGWIEVNGNRSEWLSSFSIADTEKMLRAQAEKQGMRVTGFMSQAL